MVDTIFNKSLLSLVPYQSGINDCEVNSNGPNTLACANQGVCVDVVRYDGDFSCDCTNVDGAVDENCRTEADLAALQGGGVTDGGLDSASLASIAVAVVLFVICIVFLIYFRHQRLLKLRPHDFASELQQLREKGLLLDYHETRVPQELNRVRITMLEKLGEGAFGLVQKGLYNPNSSVIPEFPVAVKTLHEGYSSDERTELLKEATITAQFEHENVVGLIGVVTSGDPLLLVLQFCEKGALKSLLENSGDSIPMHILVEYSYGIACGMEYLHERHFVHRDLAARNVLLDSADRPKVADFGMSRELDNAEYYRPANSQRMPLRWSSVEVLKSQKFSEKSDVWSYGVTMMEVFSKGETPYKTLMNSVVIDKVMDGYVLPCPTRCTGVDKQIYDTIIHPCFAYNPDDRPTFSDLCARWRRRGARGSVTAASLQSSPVAGYRDTSGNTYMTDGSAAGSIAPEYYGIASDGSIISDGDAASADRRDSVSRSASNSPINSASSNPKRFSSESVRSEESTYEYEFVSPPSGGTGASASLGYRVISEIHEDIGGSSPLAMQGIPEESQTEPQPDGSFLVIESES